MAIRPYRAEQAPPLRYQRSDRVVPIESRRRRRTLKRSGYDEKSPLKGLFASPFSGLPGFFYSRQVLTGGDRAGHRPSVPDDARASPARFYGADDTA
jgi:hypothetical protein